MSAFRAGGREYGKVGKFSALAIGEALLYEYDFGSTTEIIFTVVAEIERPKQKERVQLLARNVPEQERCDECGAPTTYVDVTEGIHLCDECSENSDEGMLMLITNSPRCGELNIWTLDPSKPFPAAAEGKRKARRGVDTANPIAARTTMTIIIL